MKRKMSAARCLRIAIDTLFENPEHPTGAIDYLRNVARVFPHAAPQHEYYLFVSQRNIRYFLEFERSNLHFIQCFRSNENLPLRILTQQIVLPFLMEKYECDILFAPGNACPLWGDFCRVLKINTLHQYHTPEVIGYGRSLYRRFSFEASAKVATDVIANTITTKTDICKLMGVPEKKVTVICEALYDIYAPVSWAQALDVRARYGLGDDYILFVSVLYPYKNVETLIKSFAHLLKANHPSLRLAIVGRDFDSQEAKLKALTADLGVADKVKFLGFVPAEDMPAIYSGAQVFVFPSLAETFGKPLVEAMQCGVPIVAANTSCIPEVLGNAGLLVNPLDPAEMAAAIAQIIENDSVRSDLINRGLIRGRDFNWETAARQTLDILERAFDRWKTSKQCLPRN